MILVGIDPSSQEKNNGFASYTIGGKALTLVESGTIEEMQQFVLSMSDTAKDIPTAFCVVIEDPAGDPVAYGGIRQALAVKNRPTKDFTATIGRLLKTAYSVGKCAQIAASLRRFCDLHKISYITVKPSERKRADKQKQNGWPLWIKDLPTKTTAAQFTALTGYTARTNEHGRDAGTLVYGRTGRSVKTLLTIQNAK